MQYHQTLVPLLGLFALVTLAYGKFKLAGDCWLFPVMFAQMEFYVHFTPIRSVHSTVSGHFPFITLRILTHE